MDAATTTEETHAAVYDFRSRFVFEHLRRVAIRL